MNRHLRHLLVIASLAILSYIAIDWYSRNAYFRTTGASIAPIVATPGLKDLGIPPAPAGTQEASIQALEQKSIVDTYTYLTEIHRNTPGDWAEVSRDARDLVLFHPLTNTELREKVDRDLRGLPPYHSVKPSLESALNMEQARAKAFYDRLQSDLPHLSDEQLLQTRIKLTLALAMLHTQRLFLDPRTGIPLPFLDMADHFARVTREMTNLELRRRNLTE